MASKGYINSLLNQLDTSIKRVLSPAFEHVLDSLRFGSVTDQTRAENFQAYFFSATTPSTASTEFSIAHRLNQTPRNLIPILPLDDTTAQIVPLKCSRVADGQRIYLTSSSTSAAIFVMVEV